MNNPEYKNLLQSYYQKQQLQLPIYIARSIESGYISCVILDDGTKIDGQVGTRKKDAEKLAAFEACKYLKLINNSSKSKAVKPLKSLKPDSILFVDVENMPKFIDEVVKTIDIDIVAVVGEHHCLSQVTYHSKNVTKIISPSSRRNGSDTCIQVYVGHYLVNSKYKNYYIATRDNFGPALADMINSSTLAWTNKSGKVVTKISDII